MGPPDTEASMADNLDPIDFSTFAISLAGTVSLHLNPTSGQFDLALAKQTIDIMAMLGTKTKGNLTADEDKLLSSLLYETRMAYVDAAKAQG